MTKLVEPLVSGESAALVENAGGSSDVLLICEHAGRQIPEFISSLGVDDETMSTHIAWDLGASALSRLLSARLDAPLILQRYSRLVYDCNRCFDAVDAITEVSDDVVIPENKGLSMAQRKRRFEVVYQPFFEAIRTIIESRTQQGRQPVIVTVHSFTPVYKGRRRIVDLGVLHDSDTRLADEVLSRAQRDKGYHIARNQPYSAEDGVTHTLITHGIRHNFRNLMFEVRNDLIADADSREQWAERLGNLLTVALDIESGQRVMQ